LGSQFHHIDGGLETGGFGVEDEPGNFGHLLSSITISDRPSNFPVH
jgi:hypothetical protein